MINDFRVQPIQLKQKQTHYRGSDILDVRFSNVVICSRKCSGKTTLIARILEHILDGDIVGIFASTHNKDETFAHIKHMLTERGVGLFCADDIIDDDGESLITQFMDAEKGDQPYIHIFDDLGEAMRSKKIDQYLKTNRHHHVKNIISVQSATDLTPSGWRQIDYCILMGGLPLDKLERIHRQMTVACTFPELLSVYNRACVDKYDFLCIDVTSNRFIKNLNTIIE